ncbi:MAG: 5-carboxymethyl-2-hydroxymuconate semialdehyde dehydrogenase oxidoreductase, partial [Rhodocyclales bacterium]|nr:5-carboxymethyl-2-hydroxymuconate semialdehyde dehydrogenase oxidoreductase [Rhodocyclales bacterium]
MKDILNFIDGEFASKPGGHTFEKRSPTDNRVVARVAAASRA